MKIAVIGADGQLGVDVVTAFTANGDDVASLTHADIELSDKDSAANSLNALRPKIVVNTAAMHHVDKCEQDPAKAFAVNGLGAKNLALAAKEIGATLVHVSTDYVF